MSQTELAKTISKFSYDEKRISKKELELVVLHLLAQISELRSLVKDAGIEI